MVDLVIESGHMTQRIVSKLGTPAKYVSHGQSDDNMFELQRNLRYRQFGPHSLS